MKSNLLFSFAVGAFLSVFLPTQAKANCSAEVIVNGTVELTFYQSSGTLYQWKTLLPVSNMSFEGTRVTPSNIPGGKDTVVFIFRGTSLGYSYLRFENENVSTGEISQASNCTILVKSR